MWFWSLLGSPTLALDLVLFQILYWYMLGLLPHASANSYNVEGCKSVVLVPFGVFLVSMIARPFAAAPAKRFRMIKSSVIPSFRHLKKRSPEGSVVIPALTCDPLNLDSPPSFRNAPRLSFPRRRESRSASDRSQSTRPPAAPKALFPLVYFSTQ